MSDKQHPCPVNEINLVFSLSAAPASKKQFFRHEIANIQNDFAAAQGSVMNLDTSVPALSIDVRVDKRGMVFRVWNPAVILGSTVAEILVPMRSLPKDAFQAYKTIVQNPNRMPNYEVVRAQLHAQMVNGLKERAGEKGLQLDNGRHMHYALRKTISLWFDAFVRPDGP